MSIVNLMRAPGHSAWFSDAWRQIVDDHIPNLLKSPNTVIHEIEPMLAHQFEGNLLGYLTAVRVPEYLHYVTIKLNGFKDGSELNESTLRILLPHEPDLEKHMQIFRTTYS